MNERIDRVLKKMEDKGLSQLLVSAEYPFSDRNHG